MVWILEEQFAASAVAQLTADLRCKNFETLLIIKKFLLSNSGYDNCYFFQLSPLLSKRLVILSSQLGLNCKKLCLATGHFIVTRPVMTIKCRKTLCSFLPYCITIWISTIKSLQSYTKLLQRDCIGKQRRVKARLDLLVTDFTSLAVTYASGHARWEIQ